jgi:two-component system, OmpR family, sensor histidine kinase BaeS
MKAPGLLGRSILASVLVASVAIVATALLTLNVTQDSLERQQVHREAADQHVVARLLAFGREHPDWTGADELLRRLAGKGQRLVVTDVHGHRLAATAGGATTSADPSAVLNPLGTVIDAATSDLPRSYRALGLPGVFLDARSSGARIAAAAQSYQGVALCFPGSGEVRPWASGLPRPLLVTDVCSNAGSIATERGTGPARLLARLNNAVVLDEGRCLRQRAVPSRLVTLNAAVPRGGTPTLASVSIPAVAARGTGGAVQRVRDSWDDCATSTLTRHLTPLVAPVALLYIDQTRSVTDGIVDRIGTIHIAEAVGAVLLAAVAASLLASRQVLQPVHRLTVATQQMARGRLSTRVEIDGRDEVARLARSFNEMAAALAGAEEQRRRMVDDIAHELRTPLTNIRGYLEAGHDGVLPRDEEWSASLLEEAALLQHVVDDLQTLAQADAGRLTVQPDTTDLAGTVDLAVQAMSGYAASQGVRVERTGVTPPIAHDRFRMRQVTGNLLANALRHAPRDSRVTVDISPADPATLAVTMTVRDHGPGIAAEHLPHVFDRFYRADPSRTRDTGGSGLGLAIVEQLVRAHGGTVTAFNAPDGGAVFEVSLRPGPQPSPSGSSAAPPGWP